MSQDHNESAECKIGPLQKLFADPDRWIQRDYRIGNKYCLSGAVEEFYPNDLSIEIKQRIREYIKEYVRKRTGTIFAGYALQIENWNDDKNRTIEDIQELVKKLNI